MFNKPLIPLYLYQGRPLPRPQRLYDYVLAAQGLIKRLETPYVSADQLLVPIEAPLTGLGLTNYPLQPVRFKLPRIPGSLLAEALADARQNLALEYVYHFRFDAAGRQWRVTRPEQAQSRTHVGYRSDPAGIVLDLHSHNRMGAFFSPTDDRDELGGRFYAVMGHLERDKPELILRLGFYGTWLYNVPALLLFDDITPFEEVYLDTVEPAEVVDPEPVAGRGGWLTSLFQGRT